MSGISWKAILSDYVTPTLSADRNFKKNLRNLLTREVRHARTKMEATVRTWNHDVTFKVKTQLRVTDNVLGFSVETDNPIWGFLDKGTSYRSRRMSPDYQPKTQENTFNSFMGGGHVVGKARMPGIKARNWSDILQEDIDTRVEFDVERLVDQFAQEAG